MSTIMSGTAGPCRNLLIKKGSTFGALPFVVTADGRASSDREDITGAVITAQIRQTPSGAAIRKFAATVTDAANGEFSLHLTAQSTAQLSAGDSPADPASHYWWDGEIEFPGGEVRPIGRGQVFVHA